MEEVSPINGQNLSAANTLRCIFSLRIPKSLWFGEQSKLFCAPRRANSSPSKSRKPYCISKEKFQTHFSTQKWFCAKSYNCPCSRNRNFSLLHSLEVSTLSVFVTSKPSRSVHTALFEASFPIETTSILSLFLGKGSCCWAFLFILPFAKVPIPCLLKGSLPPRGQLVALSSLLKAFTILLGNAVLWSRSLLLVATFTLKGASFPTPKGTFCLYFPPWNLNYAASNLSSRGPIAISLFPPSSLSYIAVLAN